MAERKRTMTQLCKDCPERHTACHDTCQRFAAWRKWHVAEIHYTNAQHAAEHISCNDFNKEGWMGGHRK